MQLFLPVLCMAAIAAGQLCSTGDLQCCQTLKPASEAVASDPSLSTLAGLLGIDLGRESGGVGLTCNPLSVIGANSNQCSAQVVCCTNNTFNGVIALGCTPAKGFE